MNAVEEKIDDLNSILRITVDEKDYVDQVNATLKKYSKEANIPGFRPGKVPMGFIKKKFGKSVLAEELNKLVGKSLNDFIQTNNIDVLGQPLPKDDEEVKGDFNNPGTFEFAYEIGIAPEFEISLSKKNKFDYLKVAISDDMLNKEVENLARRYGKLVEAEKISERDMVIGEFAQVDGDIKNTSTISLEFITDEKVKKQFVGKKVGAEIKVDPKKVSRDNKDLAAMLAISEDEATNLEGEFNFTISEIKTMVPAAIDQELFDKLFGEGNVKSEDELKDKIKADLVNMFSKDSDNLFAQKVIDSLIEKSKFELPETFLKKWILASNENELTEAQIEADFDNYKNSLKWQLIQNKIVKEHNLEVKPEEAVAYTKQLLANQYAQYGMPAPEDKELVDQAKSVLGNQDEANKIYDNLYSGKLMQFFKETVKVNEKELEYDKFVAEATAQK
ncbi:MAG: trigger factor [Putridiphycobacter sp.]